MTQTDYTWQIPDPDTQPDFYADVPMKRAMAWVIDTVLVILLCVLAVVLTAFTGLFFLPLLFLTVNFVYRAVTLARGSATLGMRVMAIEFRKLSGERMDGITAAMHSAGFTVSWMFFPAQLVSMMLMMTSARGQGLSDFWLGTVALNRAAST